MLETFEVEDHNNNIIERNIPVSSVLIAMFKPKKHVSYVAGMGTEFEKEKTFAISRIGADRLGK